jgi:hypothetical protein
MVRALSFEPWSPSPNASASFASQSNTAAAARRVALISNRLMQVNAGGLPFEIT